MKALYMLSGGLFAIAVRDFMDGSFLGWPALGLGLGCFIGAEFRHGAKQRRIMQALRNLRELRGILGDR